MPGEDIVKLAIILLCLLFSAFFSSCEAAFLSLQKTTRLAHMVNTGHSGAARVAKMLDQPGKLLSTILLGNNLINVAFTALITAMTLAFLENGLGIIVSTAIATSLLLVLGEILPKTIAVRHAERLVLIYAKPLQFIEVLLYPLILVLQWASQLSTVGGDKDVSQSSITEAELRSLIDIGEAEGEFEPEEAEMLEGVFRFGDRQVRDIMTPRTEIIFVERGSSLGDLLNIYSNHPRTRFPVFKETTDDIVGILSAKDILRTMSSRPISHDESITEIIRDAYFVPETKRIAELFDELRQSGNQIAIAVDEFGGIAGLVTLKELLEEVVGSMGEEGASPQEEYEAIGENTFQVEGGMSIDETREELGIDLPSGDFETIAGFVLDILGHIPTQGEQFEYGNLKIEITNMKDLKIETVKLTKT